MDAVLELLASHRSVRRFMPRDVEPALLCAIYAAAQRSPSWNNAQNVTLIEIRDKARKDVLATLCGNQGSIRQAQASTAPSSWSQAVSARYAAMPAYAAVAGALQAQGFRFCANS